MTVAVVGVVMVILCSSGDAAIAAIASECRSFDTAGTGPDRETPAL